MLARNNNRYYILQVISQQTRQAIYAYSNSLNAKKFPSKKFQLYGFVCHTESRKNCLYHILVHLFRILREILTKKKLLKTKRLTRTTTAFCFCNPFHTNCIFGTSYAAHAYMCYAAHTLRTYMHKKSFNISVDWVDFTHIFVQVNMLKAFAIFFNNYSSIQIRMDFLKCYIFILQYKQQLFLKFRL